MEGMPRTTSAENVSLFESKYVRGTRYDYPTKSVNQTLPRIGETFDGMYGIRYTTYRSDDKKIASLGDKPVLMQVQGGWFEVVPASEVSKEYQKKISGFSKDCIVLVPQA